jgi:carbonic anhydrase/acetyltransferase-like protein (isoleucine patch superfamily)
MARMPDVHPPSVVIGPDTYIAPTAFVGGAVRLGAACAVMHHVTIRGDVSKITIGDRVNIQDGSVVHTRSGVDLHIGDGVAIGHRAVVHCKSVGPRTLIGIGAIVLDDCEIGAECIIAAGAVVPPGTVVPPRTVVMGVPAKPVRSTTDDELHYIDEVVANYVELGRTHARGDYPNAAPPVDVRSRRPGRA